jgi:hypothetical protein
MERAEYDTGIINIKAFWCVIPCNLVESTKVLVEISATFFKTENKVHPEDGRNRF